MSQLHQQLTHKITELEQIKKVRQHTVVLQERLQFEQAALSSMEKVLDKEQRDVEALEREGISTMFRKWMGDREEKLDKEREEYLKASLRFNELYKSVELIRFELDLLLKKEQSEERVAAELVQLYTQREEEILEKDPVLALALKAILTQSDQLAKYSLDVEEAITAGQITNQFVTKAEQFLHEAKNWGQREMWAGSQQNTGHMKYRAIDHARGMVQEARHSLIKFAKELRDVDASFQLNIHLEIESFGQFSNVFFDNLITDYFIQQKVNKSLESVSRTRQEIERILTVLSKERSRISAKMTNLEAERKLIVSNKD